MVGHSSKVLRRWRVAAPAAMALVLAVYLAGCFTLDAKIEADGSGTLELRYPVAPNAKVEIEKMRWTSPHVTVKSLELKGDNTAIVAVAFDDVTALSTADGFENVQATKTREGEDEILKIVIKNPHQNPTAKDPGKPGPTLTIAYPGKVKEANRDGKVDGNKVTWNVPLMDMIRNPSVELIARYPAAGGPSTTTSTTEPPKDKSTTTTVPPKAAPKGKKAASDKK